MTDLLPNCKIVTDAYPIAIAGYEARTETGYAQAAKTLKTLIDVRASSLYVEQRRNALVDDSDHAAIRAEFANDANRMNGIGNELADDLERDVLIAAEWESATRLLKFVTGQ